MAGIWQELAAVHMKKMLVSMAMQRPLSMHLLTSLVTRIWQQQLMLLHVDEFRSIDALHDRNFSSQLDAEGLYDLVLEATGDEAKASKAMAARAIARSGRFSGEIRPRKAR